MSNEKAKIVIKNDINVTKVGYGNSGFIHTWAEIHRPGMEIFYVSFAAAESTFSKMMSWDIGKFYDEAGRSYNGKYSYDITDADAQKLIESVEKDMIAPSRFNLLFSNCSMYLGDLLQEVGIRDFKNVITPFGVQARMGILSLRDSIKGFIGGLFNFEKKSQVASDTYTVQNMGLLGNNYTNPLSNYISNGIFGSNSNLNDQYLTQSQNNYSIDAYGNAIYHLDAEKLLFNNYKEESLTINEKSDGLIAPEQEALLLSDSMASFGNTHSSGITSDFIGGINTNDSVLLLASSAM